MLETWVQSLGWEDPLEEGMSAHSRVLAWRIPPWTEEPGRLQSMGLQRVGHDWATKHPFLVISNLFFKRTLICTAIAGEWSSEVVFNYIKNTWNTLSVKIKNLRPAATKVIRGTESVWAAGTTGVRWVWQGHGGKEVGTEAAVLI